MTNKYVLSRQAKGAVGRGALTSEEELLPFLGVIVAVALHPVPRLDSYWSDNVFLCVAGTISCKIFSDKHNKIKPADSLYRFRIKLVHMHILLDGSLKTRKQEFISK